VALGEVAELERDAIQPEKIQEGTTYLGLEHIAAGGEILSSGTVGAGELKSTKFQYTPEHVLYGKLRPYLAKVALPNNSGVCTTEIIPIRPGSHLDRRFLAYYLRQPEQVERATSLSTGANLPRLSPNALAQFQIPLPPLPEQRRIAAILDEADALRAKRRAALAQLDEMARAIFVEMFGDLTSSLEKWPTHPLGQSVRVVGGFAFKSEDFTDSGYGVVRISNLQDGHVDLNNVVFISPERLGNGVKFEVASGSILMAMSGATTGKIGIVPDNLCKKLYLNQRVADFRLKNPTLITRDFLIAVLTSEYYQNMIWQSAAGAAQPNISSKQLQEIPIPYPPLSLQEQFGLRVQQIESLKNASQGQFEIIDVFFASLQHRAFRGEL
jgi:type I restriction enzyme S subunit